MKGSIFVEIDFIALVIFSILLPIGLYTYMMRKSAISRKTVLIFGVLMIALAGVDLYLLQRLKIASIASTSPLDDVVFASEISVALYLLPVLFAGIGVNMISHILIHHLSDAERRFDRGQR